MLQHCDAESVIDKTDLYLADFPTLNAVDESSQNTKSVWQNRSMVREHLLHDKTFRKFSAFLRKKLTTDEVQRGGSRRYIVENDRFLDTFPPCIPSTNFLETKQVADQVVQNVASTFSTTKAFEKFQRFFFRIQRPKSYSATELSKQRWKMTAFWPFLTAAVLDPNRTRVDRTGQNRVPS